MSSDNLLATWQANFKRDLQTLSQLTLLRTRRNDEAVRKEMQQLFQSISNSLSRLESGKTVLETYVSAQRAQLSQLEDVHRKVALQKRRVTDMRASIPAELSESLGMNADPTAPLSRLPSADTADVKENLPSKENLSTNIAHHDKPVKTKKLKKKASGNGAAAKPKSTNTKPKVQKQDHSSGRSDDVPVIRAVDQEELNAAPQYVRGRLTVAKIDGVVTKLNAIARKKYKLLAVPFRELNSSDMTARQQMEEQECPETEGRHFLSDHDIRIFGGYRMDATVKASINMLRHTGALKEVRGKNRSRMLIIQ